MTQDKLKQPAARGKATKASANGNGKQATKADTTPKVDPKVADFVGKLEGKVPLKTVAEQRYATKLAKHAVGIRKTRAGIGHADRDRAKRIREAADELVAS